MMPGRTIALVSMMLLALASCRSKPAAPVSVTPSEPAPEPTVSPKAVSPEPAPSAAVAEPARKPSAVAVVPPRESNPYIAPPVRRAGDLTVEAPPREPDEEFFGRLRSHIDGSLSKGSPRVWVGPQVPGFVPLMEDTMELFLLDRVGDEFMAFYRDPYGASSCGLGGDVNCSYFVVLYDLEGNERWTFDPNEHLSRSTYLEIQDIRYADGVLYFNEACQSYSSGAKGKCSALVAYDPQAKEIRWRTRPLVSNGDFLVHGDYVITGYGFTAERDFIYVVRRRDGKVVHKVPLRKATMHFDLLSDEVLEVVVYPGTKRWFRLKGWQTGKPRLIKTEPPGAQGPNRITTGRG